MLPQTFPCTCVPAPTPRVLLTGNEAADLASMAGQQISIQEVYSRIVTGEEGEFSLVIIGSSKRRKGERITFDRCRYGAPVQDVHTPRTRNADGSKPAPGTVIGGHLRNATLPLTDLTTKPRYVSPKISHIIGFQGMKVIH